ncbi:family 10 glycosylhydrolase [Candidatus Sumerlaeota bacterium]|nr:family 10 glycosylhydrolase [Candidatus Sumerlaeota bacterium]
MSACSKKSHLLLVFLLLALFACRTWKEKIIHDLNQTSEARRTGKERKKYAADRGESRTNPEFRAVWITRYSFKSPEDVKTIVKNLQDYNFNAMILQIRGNGSCFFDSQIEPWAEELGGPPPGWDPLAVAVEEAHRAGIQVHAWINAMPGWNGDTPPKSPVQIWNKNPEWFMNPLSQKGKPPRLQKGYTFISPCIPDVRKHIFDLTCDLASRYKVDGIHFDYIRFPGPDYSYDEKSLAEFKKSSGKDFREHPEQWAEFRRGALNSLISECYAGIHEIRPDIAVSAATWANFPEGSINYFQDAHGWLAKGVLDISMPMIYRSSHETFRKLLEDHVLNNHQRFVYPGIGAYMIEDKETLLKQVETCRSLNTGGLAFFDYFSLFKDHLPSQFADELLKGPFQEPVPCPKLNWLLIRDDDNTGPLIKNVRVEPYPVESGKPFKVLCEITDASGVYDATGGSYEKGVYLVYGADPFFPAGKEATLSLSDNDAYATDQDIIFSEKYDALYFRIYARDNDADVNEGGLMDRALGSSELVRVSLNRILKEYSCEKSFTEPFCGLQYPAADDRNRLWACIRNENAVMIFNPDGSPSPNSPIKTAWAEEKKSVPIETPAGLAIDRERGIAYISSGNRILRLDTDSGQPLPAFEMKDMICGALAIDGKGDIYIANLTRRRWTKISPDGKPLFDIQIACVSPDDSMYDNPSLTRGIAVTQDGASVYLLCEDDRVVDIFQTDRERYPGEYRYQGKLTTVSPRPGAINIGNDERIYVSEGDGRIRIFSISGEFLGDIAGGRPPLDSPSGIAFSPDGKTMYIAESGDFQFKRPVQKWLRK